MSNMKVARSLTERAIVAFTEFPVYVEIHIAEDEFPPRLDFHNVKENLVRAFVEENIEQLECFEVVRIAIMPTGNYSFTGVGWDGKHYSKFERIKTQTVGDTMYFAADHTCGYVWDPVDLKVCSRDDVSGHRITHVGDYLPMFAGEPREVVHLPNEAVPSGMDERLMSLSVKALDYMFACQYIDKNKNLSQVQDYLRNTDVLDAAASIGTSNNSKVEMHTVRVSQESYPWQDVIKSLTSEGKNEWLDSPISKDDINVNIVDGYLGKETIYVHNPEMLASPHEISALVDYVCGIPTRSSINFAWRCPGGQHLEFFVNVLVSADKVLIRLWINNNYSGMATLPRKSDVTSWSHWAAEHSETMKGVMAGVFLTVLPLLWVFKGGKDYNLFRIDEQTYSMQICDVPVELKHEDMDFRIAVIYNDAGVLELGYRTEVDAHQTYNILA